VFDSSSSCGLLGKLLDLVPLIYEELKDTRKILVSSKKHRRGRKGNGADAKKKYSNGCQGRLKTRIKIIRVK
jgi:hypothetical protein